MSADGNRIAADVSERTARGTRALENGHGKYFIVEEGVGEPRFALDPGAGELRTWDDVAWSHFGLGESYGAYLDDSQASVRHVGRIDNVRSLPLLRSSERG